MRTTNDLIFKRGKTIENQKRHQAVMVEEIQYQVQQLAEALSDVPAKHDQLKLDTDELKK